MHFRRSQLTGPNAIAIANSEKPDSFSVHRAPQPHSPRPHAGHAPAGEGLEALPLTPLAELGWAGPARTVFTAGMDCILAPEHISATSPQGRELFRQSAGRLAASLKTAPRGQTELTWVGREGHVGVGRDRSGQPSAAPTPKSSGLAGEMGALPCGRILEPLSTAAKARGGPRGGEVTGGKQRRSLTATHRPHETRLSPSSTSPVEYTTT